MNNITKMGINMNRNTDSRGFMRKLILIFLSVLVMIFTSCKGLFRHSENLVENNIVLNIQSEYSRDVFGPAAINISEITSWTLEFVDSNENKITKNNVVAQDGKLSEYVPEGIYTITVTGTLDDVTVVGKVTDIEIQKNEVTQEKVLVGYSSSSTGTIEFTLIDFNRVIPSEDYNVSIKNKYKFKLSPIGEGDEIVISSDEVAEETKNGWQISGIYTLNMTDSEKALIKESDGYKILTISKTKIPSGDYYIHIFYENEPLEFAYNIAQIRDNQTSSKVDYTLKARGLKTFYITNKDSEFNGLTSDYPINTDAALTWLGENLNNWKEANLNFSTYMVSEDADVYEYFASVTPKINVELLKAAVDNTKKINFYVDGKELGTYAYSGSGKKIELDLVNAYVDNLYFYTDSEKAAQTIDLSAYYDSSLNICLENTTITYYSNGNGQGTICTFISSNLATDDTACSTPIIDYTRLFSECLKMTLTVLNANGEEVNDPLYIYKQVSSRQGGEYNEKYYTVIGGKGTVSISEKIPNFSLTTESGVNKATISDEVTKFISVLNEGDCFSVGTTYKWYLNNQEVASGTVTGSATADLTYSLNPVNNAVAIVGINTISLIVEYDGVLRSSSMKFTLKAPVEWMNMMWSPKISGDRYLKYIQYGMFKDSAIAEPDFSDAFLVIDKEEETVIDFAYDEYGNLYVATETATAGTVTKYTNTNGNYSTLSGVVIYEYSKDTISDFRMYGNTDKNTLYFGMLKPKGSSKDTPIIKIKNPNLINRKIEAADISSEVGASALAIEYPGLAENSINSLSEFIVVEADVVDTHFSGKTEIAYFIMDNNDGTHYPHTSTYLMTTTKTWNSSDTDPDTYFIRNCNYVTSVDSVTGNPSDTSFGSKLTKATTDGSEGSGTIASITDVTTDGTYIYILVNENTETSSEFVPSTINSRGGVIKMNKMGEIIQWNGTTDVLGWDSTAKITSKKDTGTGTVFSDVVQPKNYSDYFLGPRKFVAIKPEKLVIADDGCFIDETNYKVINKNRIITVDLESGTFESVKDTGAKFMFEATGYSCYQAE